jgi:hypothetical protein
MDELAGAFDPSLATNVQGLLTGGTSPFNIRELDPWTQATHYEYQQPVPAPQQNANIRTVNPFSGAQAWQGPHQQPAGLPNLSLGDILTPSNKQIPVGSFRPQQQQQQSQGRAGSSETAVLSQANMGDRPLNLTTPSGGPSAGRTQQRSKVDPLQILSLLANFIPGQGSNLPAQFPVVGGPYQPLKSAFSR